MRPATPPDPPLLLVVAIWAVLGGFALALAAAVTDLPPAIGFAGVALVVVGSVVAGVTIYRLGRRTGASAGRSLWAALRTAFGFLSTSHSPP